MLLLECCTGQELRQKCDDAYIRDSLVPALFCISDILSSHGSRENKRNSPIRYTRVGAFIDQEFANVEVSFVGGTLIQIKP